MPAVPRPQRAGHPLRAGPARVPGLPGLDLQELALGDHLHAPLAQGQRHGARRRLSSAGAAASAAAEAEGDLVRVLQLVRLERLDAQAVDGGAVGRAEVVEDPRPAE